MQNESTSWWRERRHFLREAFVRGLQPHAWAVGLASLVTGLTIFGAVGWLWDRKRLGVELMLAWFVLILIEGAFRLHRASAARLAELEAEPKPHLRFMHTEVEPARVVSAVSPFAVAAPSPAAGSVTSTQALSATPLESTGLSPLPVYNDFARVQIANDPPLGVRGKRAERVVAKITFMAPDGSVLLDGILGRWAETPSRLETGRLGLSLDEAQLDLDANGLPHALDIAMKRPGDAECYAYNHENSGAADLRLAKHRLNGAEIRVRVVLRSVNADDLTGDFILRNLSPAEHLTFEMAEATL